MLGMRRHITRSKRKQALKAMVELWKQELIKRWANVNVLQRHRTC